MRTSFDLLVRLLQRQVRNERSSEKSEYVLGGIRVDIKLVMVMYVEGNILI